MLNRRNVDKEIIDKGWNEMSLLLDAEMPVVRNKRRGLIFWLWGIFFLGMAGAFVWYNFSGNGSSDLHHLEPQQLKDENPTIVQSNSKAGIDNKDNTGNGLIDEPGITQEDGKFILERSNGNEINEPLDFNPAHSKEASSPELREDLVSTVKKEIKQGLDKIKNENISTASDLENIISSNNIDGKTMEIRSNRMVLDINSLPISVHALTWERTFENDLRIEPVIESTLNPWMVYINSRLIQYEHFNLEMGMGYEMKLSSRFSIVPQIGFGWDEVNYRKSEAQSRAVEFSTANGLDSERFISNLNKGVKGNYVGLSLDASFQVKGNWYFNSGLNYHVPSETFNSGSDELAFEDNSSEPSAEMSASSSIKSNHDLFLRFGISNRINGNYTLGIYFYNQLNDPYEVLINEMKDTQATSSFFPRRKSLNIFMEYRF
ncbi:MAG: hypothetical protein HKN68_13775 [Saprospiraceae bacterium]|nr:hypothetical protein [Saprospiraceae bacterium]